MRFIMSNNELQNKVAQLESTVDVMETELSYLNEILLKCGFPQGINSLKQTIEDLLAEGNQGIDPNEPPAFNFR